MCTHLQNYIAMKLDEAHDKTRFIEIFHAFD